MTQQVSEVTRGSITGISDKQIADSPVILEYPFDALSNSIRCEMYDCATWISTQEWHTIAYMQMNYDIKRDSFITISHWMMFDIQESGAKYDGIFPVVEETWRWVANFTKFPSSDEFERELSGKIAFTGLLIPHIVGGALEWQTGRSSLGLISNPFYTPTRNGFKHKTKDKYWSRISDGFIRDDIETRINTK